MDPLHRVTSNRTLSDIWDLLPVIQVPKVPAYLHALVLMGWGLRVPAHGFQDPLDRGNILEDLLCQVNRPSSLDRHVACHRCRVNP